MSAEAKKSQREEVKMRHEASLPNIEKMSRLGALLQLPGTTSAFKSPLPRTNGSGVANRGRRAPSAASPICGGAPPRRAACWLPQHSTAGACWLAFSSRLCAGFVLG
jgi:hypothetical protein